MHIRTRITSMILCRLFKTKPNISAGLKRHRRDSLRTQLKMDKGRKEGNQIAIMRAVSVFFVMTTTKV